MDTRSGTWLGQQENRRAENHSMLDFVEGSWSFVTVSRRSKLPACERYNGESEIESDARGFVKFIDRGETDSISISAHQSQVLWAMTL